MTNLDESTLGLSVYNAVAKCGAITAAQAFEHLRSFWRSDISIDEVAAGVSYLRARHFLTDEDPLRAARMTPRGTPHPLRRSALDKRELVLL